MHRSCKGLRTRLSLCTCAARICSVAYVSSRIDASVTLAWVVLFCPVSTLSRFVTVVLSSLMSAVLIMSVCSGVCNSLDLLAVTDPPVFCDLLKVDTFTIDLYRWHPLERLCFMRVRSVLSRPSVRVIAVVKYTTRSWCARITWKVLLMNVLIRVLYAWLTSPNVWKHTCTWISYTR